MVTNIAERLKENKRPVIKSIFESVNTKILAKGLCQGVSLKEHTAPNKAQILVIEGEIDFNMGTDSYRFEKLDRYDIPPKAKHSVVAVEDALFY